MSWADGSSIHPFVNAWREHGHVQASGLHGVFHSIVPVWKAALIMGTCGTGPHQGTPRAGLPTGDSNELEPELSTTQLLVVAKVLLVNGYVSGFIGLWFESRAIVKMWLSGREDRALLRSNPSARPGLRSKSGRLRLPAHFLASRGGRGLGFFEGSPRR